MEEHPIHWTVEFYIIKTTLQSLYNIKTAANPQGRLAKKNIFIQAHRSLLLNAAKRFLLKGSWPGR
jgi:hypothetical protein